MGERCGFILVLLMVGCGEAGQPGPQGTQGSAGLDGSSVTIKLTRFSSEPSVCPSNSGVIIQSIKRTLPQDEVLSSAIVCDGVSAVDAPISPFDIVEVIHPCPSITTSFREVLLRLRDGTVIASFSDDEQGKNTRLSILVPGTYIDTDNSHCIFTMNPDGTIS